MAAAAVSSKYIAFLNGNKWMSLDEKNSSITIDEFNKRILYIKAFYFGSSSRQGKEAEIGDVSSINGVDIHPRINTWDSNRI